MTLINDFLSLIYPSYCEACNALLFKHEEMICNVCRNGLPKSNYHQNPNNPVQKMLAGRVPIEQTACLYVFEKGGKVQQLLHAIKYEQQTKLAYKLGAILYDEIKSDIVLNSVDFVVPVPLHPNKLKQRGYNQSEEFAKGLCELWHKPLNTSNLKRLKETSSQTRKRKYERWQNVKGVFDVEDAGKFAQKHVLLVDDVLTTGATLEAVWQCLKDIPELRISVAAIAFAER